MIGHQHQKHLLTLAGAEQVTAGGLRESAPVVLLETADRPVPSSHLQPHHLRHLMVD